MRLVHLPIYSAPRNLNGCSAWNISKALWGHLTEKHDDLFVHQFFPEIRGGTKATRWEFKDEPEAHRPRVLLHHVPMYPLRYHELAALSMPIFEKLNPLHGELVYDVVLNERPILAPSLMRAITFFNSQKDVRPPVIHKDPFIQHPKEHGSMVGESTLINQALGYAMAEQNIITSQYEYDLLLDGSRPYLSRSVMRRMIERSVVQPSGTNTDEIDEIVKDTQKHARFTWSVVGRFSAPSNWHIELKALDALFASGANFDVQVTTLSKGVVQEGWDPSRYSYMTVHWGCPRYEYIRLMPKCHAFVAFNERHSYPQGLMEELAAGLVGLFIDRDWSRAILPKEYPFWFSSYHDGVKLMRWVYDNYERAQEMVAWVPQWMRDTYSTQVCGDTIYGLIQEQVDSWIRETHVGSGFLELVALAVEHLPREFSWRMLQEEIKTRSDTGITVGADRSHFSTTHMQVYLAMRKLELEQELGVRDTCLEAMPVYVKE